MRAKEFLAESSEDILKSFFGLTKSDGEFKSEKQKNYLLSQCNAGDGTFRLTQNLKFGPNGGASAIIHWAVMCDGKSVTKITKSTGTKGEAVYWERTPEQMAKQSAKARLHQEEVIRQYGDDRSRYLSQQEEAERTVSELRRTYDAWLSSPLRAKLRDSGFDDVMHDKDAEHLDKIQSAETLVVHCTELVARCDDTISAAKSELTGKMQDK